MTLFDKKSTPLPPNILIHQQPSAIQQQPYPTLHGIPIIPPKKQNEYDDNDDGDYSDDDDMGKLSADMNTMSSISFGTSPPQQAAFSPPENSYLTLSPRSAQIHAIAKPPPCPFYSSNPLPQEMDQALARHLRKPNAQARNSLIVQGLFHAVKALSFPLFKLPTPPSHPFELTNSLPSVQHLSSTFSPQSSHDEFTFARHSQAIPLHKSAEDEFSLSIGSPPLTNGILSPTMSPVVSPIHSPVNSPHGLSPLAQALELSPQRNDFRPDFVPPLQFQKNMFPQQPATPPPQQAKMQHIQQLQQQHQYNMQQQQQIATPPPQSAMTPPPTPPLPADAQKSSILKRLWFQKNKQEKPTSPPPQDMKVEKTKKKKKKSMTNLFNKFVDSVKKIKGSGSNSPMPQTPNSSPQMTQQKPQQSPNMMAQHAMPQQQMQQLLIQQQQQQQLQQQQLQQQQQQMPPQFMPASPFMPQLPSVPTTPMYIEKFSPPAMQNTTTFTPPSLSPTSLSPPRDEMMVYSSPQQLQSQQSSPFPMQQVPPQQQQQQPSANILDLLRMQQEQYESSQLQLQAQLQMTQYQLAQQQQQLMQMQEQQMQRQQMIFMLQHQPSPNMLQQNQQFVNTGSFFQSSVPFPSATMHYSPQMNMMQPQQKQGSRMGTPSVPQTSPINQPQQQPMYSTPMSQTPMPQHPVQQKKKPVKQEEPEDDDVDIADEDGDYSDDNEDLEAKDPTAKEAVRCTHPGCDKILANAVNLKRHMKSHMGTKPYACTVADCGKRFARRSDLNTHMRSHTGERPFICSFDGCKKTFTTCSNLRRHEKTHAKK